MASVGWADNAGLSVSCIGSNGLKQSVIVSVPISGYLFQYPVSDRMG